MSETKHESTEPEVAHAFEWGGNTRVVKGTSYRTKLPIHRAEGQPVRYGLVVAGRPMVTTGTSGPHTGSVLAASGQPRHYGKTRRVDAGVGACSTSGPGRTS